MIDLKVDGLLIRVDTYDELKAMPGFCPDLAMAPEEFGAAIGQGHWKEQVQCGLNGCHVWHNRGWVIANKAGLKTTVGHDCAREKLGLLFEESAKAFTDDRQRQERREIVRDFQSKIEYHREKLRDLFVAPYDARWAFSARTRLTQDLPRSVVHALADMAKTGNAAIFHSREATKAEIHADEARTGKKRESPLFVNAIVGRIAGIAAIRDENDLRRVLTMDIMQTLKDVEALDADTAKDIDVRRAAKWINTFDERVARAHYAFSEARRLLTRRNLLQFENADISSSEVRALRAAVAKLPDDLLPGDAREAA